MGEAPIGYENVNEHAEILSQRNDREILLNIEGMLLEQQKKIKVIEHELKRGVRFGILKEGWKMPPKPKCGDNEKHRDLFVVPVAVDTGDGWLFDWECTQCGWCAEAFDLNSSYRFEWMFRGNIAYVADLERLGFEIR